MKSFFLLFLLLSLFSCSENVLDQIDSGSTEQPDCDNVVTDASGLKYPSLEPPSSQYCGPGWGRKMCRFLRKHNGSQWSDPDNYYSEYADIKFSNFLGDAHFISFFSIDSVSASCKGWKKGETTIGRIKYKIDIKRDEEDILWFDYLYFGTSDEIEYVVTYKFEVVDGLLNFNNSDGQSFVLHPSERNYSVDSLATGEIIKLEGCFFNI